MSADWTNAYTRAHVAMKRVANTWGLEPFAARALLALFEHGVQRTDELQELLECEGSQIRRVVPDLVGVGLAEATNSLDGGPPKTGIRTRVVVTARGAQVAREMLPR